MFSTITIARVDLRYLETLDLRAGPRVEMPKLNSTRIGHLYLSGMWVGVDLRIGIKKGLFKRDWTTCSKYASRSRPNSQLGGGAI